MKNIKEMEKDLDKNKEIDSHFILPFQNILLGLKLVNKDRDRKVKTPYVKAEILIPHEIATSIQEVISSDWKFTLFGIKFKKKKK